MNLRALFAFAMGVIVLTGVLAAAGSGATLATPVVTGFSPDHGLVGSTVQINGSGFTGATTVKIGGTASSFVVNSSSMIHATVPSVPDNAAHTRAKISVFTSPGTFGSSADEFTIVLAPTIKGFTPTSGTVGSIVEIRGKNLKYVTDARLNGQSMSFTIGNIGGADVVDATVPSGSTGGTITVTNGAGTSAPSAKSYKVLPKVTGFSPSSGAVGTVVQINGTSFTGATKVKFGGKAAISFTVDDDSTIHATVPPKGLSGPIEVDTATGKGASTGSFTVTPSLAAAMGL